MAILNADDDKKIGDGCGTLLLVLVICGVVAIVLIVALTRKH